MPTTLLLLALGYAAVAHGAFHASELAVVVGVIAVALLLAFISQRPERADLGPPTLAAAALAAWYLIAALAAGNPTGAGPAAGLLFAMAATIAILRRADDTEREFLITGALIVGGFVAASAWIGVAFHHSPWAIEDNGLWRGASTITYANATGGLLAVLTLVALDRALDTAAPRAMALLAALCGLGLLATASRGALLGFAIGLVVLGALRRRETLARLVPPLIGALIGFAALAPSMPGGHRAQPVVAVVGVVVAGAIARAPARVALAGALVCVLLGFASPAARSDARAEWKPISDQRLTTSSSDRSHERTAAVDLVRDHVVAGAGPGNVDLRWSVYYFVPVTFSVRYAHDEYLQVAVEAGVVGLLIAIAGIGWVLVTTARRARVAPRDFAAAGITAGVVALTVHSATDFLWHVPLIPVTMSALLGVFTSRRAAKLSV